LNNLIAGGPVAVIGEINSPLVLASKPIIEKTGIPYMTGGTSPRTTDQSQWIYRAGGKRCSSRRCDGALCRGDPRAEERCGGP
jgi:hypothetical protein